MSRYPSPDTEQAFERFCLELLREHWRNPDLQLYGHRGEEQRGVDIYDPTFALPFRAAQCKHRKMHATLSPREIEDEVVKALKFDPPLECYTILTTAKASTHSDDAVTEINRRHRAEKKFKVKLLNWERDIEPLLDAYQSVAGMLVTFTGNQLDKMTASLQSIDSKLNSHMHVLIESNLLAASHSDIDADLEYAEQLIKQHDLDGARSFFQRIEHRKGDSLTLRQKYRIRIGFAEISLAKGKRADAGRILLSAASLLPNDDKAQINEVLGYELSGDRDKAYRIAAEKLTNQVGSTKLIACRIRTAPDMVSFDALEAMLDGESATDAEVCTALALRATSLARHTDAERCARKAIAANPSLYDPRVLLGQSLLNQEATKIECSIWESGVSLDLGRLKEAVEVMDDVIVLTESRNAFGSLPELYLLRALAKVLLQDLEGAERDFDLAIRQGPDWGPAHCRYAHFLFQQGRDEEAIASLRRAVRLGGDSEPKYVLAGILSGREDEKSRSEATGIFIDLARSVDSKRPDEALDFPPGKSYSISAAAFHSAIDELVRQDRLSDADELIVGVPESNIRQLGRLAARSRLSHARGDADAAAKHINKALDLLATDASAVDLRSLAFQLERLERHNDALGIWQQIVKDSPFGLDVRCLVRCAKLVRRFDIVLEVAEAARTSSIDDPWLFFEEVETLNSFDFERAVSLLRERIAKDSRDELLFLNLAFIGIKWHRPDLIEPHAERYPAVDKVEPENGALVVKILREYGDIQQALIYAYELLRRHPDHPAANWALCSIFYPPDSKSPELKTPLEVVQGTAVKFEEDGLKEQWVIIEDSPNPRAEIGEIQPDSTLARSLLGKRVGDRVVLSISGLRPRIAVIKEIKSKYLHVIQDVMLNWQLRFPNDNYVQFFSLSKKDESTGEVIPDFTDMELAADNQLEHLTNCELAYRENFVSVASFARCVDRLPFLATCYLVHKSGLSLRSNEGSEEERISALRILKNSHVLVLDITALAMVFLLDLKSVLANWPGKLLASQHTMLELRKTRQFFTEKIGSVGTYGKNEDGYYLQERSPEMSRAYHDGIADFVDFVEASFETGSCPQLAAMDPVKRDELEGLLGRHGLESILLAGRPGHVLLTEDLALGIVAASDFSTPRVWTQLLLAHTLDKGSISRDEYLGHIVGLLAGDVLTTRYDPHVVVKAATLSNWDVDQWPLSAILEQLAKCTNRKFVLASLALMIRSLCENSTTPVSLSAYITRILNRFSEMPHGVDFVGRLPQVLSQVFVTDAKGYQNSLEIVLAWLAARRRWPDLRLVQGPKSDPRRGI